MASTRREISGKDRERIGVLMEKKNKNSPALSKAQLLEIHDLMVQGRTMEERTIKMGKSGEGFFWIGGIGEEATGVAIGLLANKGQGIAHDYFHFHYRAGTTMLALGAKPIDTIRQMACVETDPYSGGRNFVSHYCKPEWNVMPVSSCIQVQCSQAIGTAHAQRGNRSKAITIVTSGDAGTAESDFATALVWASRPADPLPLLMIVTNNRWGISTTYDGQHGENLISDRGKSFGIRSKSVNGNDVWEAWGAIEEAMEYVRTKRLPYLLELSVSRLNGHSSASGANRTDDVDPIVEFEKKLATKKILTPEAAKKVHEQWQEKINADLKKVRTEPAPDPRTIFDHVFAEVDGDKGKDTLAESIGVDFAELTAEKYKKK